MYLNFIHILLYLCAILIFFRNETVAFSFYFLYNTTRYTQIVFRSPFMNNKSLAKMFADSLQYICDISIEICFCRLHEAIRCDAILEMDQAYPILQTLKICLILLLQFSRYIVNFLLQNSLYI